MNSDAAHKIADGAARRLGIADEDRNQDGRVTSTDPLGFSVIYSVSKLAGRYTPAIKIVSRVHLTVKPSSVSWELKSWRRTI